MKERDLTLTDIASQMSRQRRLNEETIQTSKAFLLAGGIVLLVAGLAAAGWFFFKKEKSPETSVFEPPKSLVFSDKRQIITLKSESRLQLINLIQKTLDSAIALNTILDIPILLESPQAKEFLKARRFFEVLEIEPPSNFTQSLEGNFTLGVFYFKKNSPFLILKIRSFDLALAGALDWEKNMARDLKEILSIQNVPATENRFQDKIIKNRDARILYDPDNNPVLIYAFFNKQYLVITVDFDTFEEILRRFAIPH